MRQPGVLPDQTVKKERGNHGLYKGTTLSDAEIEMLRRVIFE